MKITNATALCKFVLFHLCNISTIGHYLTPKATGQIIYAFVARGLDVGYAFLHQLSQKQTQRLQRLQNWTIRLVDERPNNALEMKEEQVKTEQMDATTNNVIYSFQQAKLASYSDE